MNDEQRKFAAKPGILGALAGKIGKPPKRGKLKDQGAINPDKTEKPIIKIGKRGRPKTHGYSGSPTESSFKAAQQRCNNPNHPAYKNYGGRGIQCLLSLVELVQEIGERPKGTTLDRIDPEGHYTKGNVRWATPQVQATNKRPSSIAYRDAAAERNVRKRQAGRALFEQTAKNFLVSVSACNSVISEANRELIAHLVSTMGAPSCNYDSKEPRDFGDKDWGLIRLPSLTRPGHKFSLRGGPFGQYKCSPQDRRFIVDLGMTDPRINCSQEELDILLAAVRGGNGKGHHVCFTGHDGLTSGVPIEGRLMAFAAALAASSYDVQFVIAAEMESLIEEYDDDVLYSKVLIIPDLFVDFGEGFGIAIQRRRIIELMKDRVRGGLPTICYAERPLGLGAELGVFLNDNFKRVDVCAATRIEHPAHTKKKEFEVEEDEDYQ